MIGEQMKKEHKEAYVEVLEVLKHMDSKYVEKIPKKLREFFEKNCSREYSFYLNPDIPFEEQELKRNTICILAMLNYNYWCEDEEHKKYLLNKYNENEIRYQEELMKKYSRENLFKRDDDLIEDKTNSVPQKYEETKWYTGILKFLKRLFNKK